MMVDLRHFILLFSAPFAFAVSSAHADEPDEHHRTHDAHVHGTWELFAALDDSQLSITIKGPLIDVVGFERAPATESEHAAIQEMHDRLAAPELMLALDDRAECNLLKPVQIILPEGFSPEGIDDHNDHGRELSEKSRRHDHKAHEEDEKHHSDHNAHTNDLELTYVFECQSPTRLRKITMTGFDAFPTIENIDAVYLGDAKQTARRLGRETQTLTIDN